MVRHPAVAVTLITCTTVAITLYLLLPGPDGSDGSDGLGCFELLRPGELTHQQQKPRTN
ncbi:hypothetical protein [Streptomyces sp. V4I2]|uniref:hypothetical protein n=1 Tax=Streptomyces sp. V4I2 TaxID=3042280 RepID=UPI0027812078|nr:hypothetical protein [Streptomyces sp. V4I2]MDQ1051116.1 hypothetical protein [Streptomyces sp. V4I2]